MVYTKYRHHILQGDLALRVREFVWQACERFEIHILCGVVSKDYVHILVSVPPNISPSDLMRGIKVGVSEDIFCIAACEKTIFGQTFWLTWYCMDIVGLDAEKIHQYKNTK